MSEHFWRFSRFFKFRELFFACAQPVLAMKYVFETFVGGINKVVYSIFFCPSVKSTSCGHQMCDRTKIPDTPDSADLGAAKSEKSAKTDFGGFRDPADLVK